LLGTPEEIIARLKKLAAGGVDYVLLVDPTGSVGALETFAKEIMPHFALPPPAAVALEEERR
jgi:alkanesulfonate monooxygenase SsuD/methylene tetrahydromethanopterin reductase-like flavin-dependent oxidoreductase (luciferase family)